MDPPNSKSTKAEKVNDSTEVTIGDGRNAPADFETAIAATGYGRFNYILLLVAMPCCMTTVFETTTMSYVLPSAECDLNLSLADKGILNAITYTGMISSAFLWGFLSDTYGRKRLLVVGFLLDSTFNVLCALSQNMVAIMVFKFMGGFVICGPFAVLMAYLSEFHSLQHRSRVMIVLGVFYSAANMLLPALAWLIIPQPWNLMVGDGLLELHSWQIFLAVSCLPGVLSGVSVMFLPESPKFLMSKGRNEQALAIFRRLHTINIGDRQAFPISELVDELRQDLPVSGKQPAAGKDDHRSAGGASEGFRQLGVMFRKPHLKNACLVYGIQFGILLGLNTFRLWVPQLFTIIEEFEHDQHQWDIGGTQATLCDMLAYKVNKTEQLQQQWLERDVSRALHGPDPVAMEPLDDVLRCTATTEGRVYLYSLIIGCVGIGAYAVTTVMINSIGNRNLLAYGLLLAGSCGTALYWARSSLVTLILSSCYITICSIASTALVGAVVAMFPTSMRTMVVSLTMMFGRTGSIIGNVVFPYLMALGCLPPFIMIGAIVIVVAMVSRLLPRTVKKPLQ
ncbi:putative metabolite transport protein YwtG [Anopheles nili]|uniref:putative metabolite transport protein YwtG n=1 Tax=Anopheles nili TaxID=185578 RepID=UPI00237A7435|nr:putative metabolite transport protein YwtG [Anopheles nili]